MLYISNGLPVSTVSFHMRLVKEYALCGLLQVYWRFRAFLRGFLWRVSLPGRATATGVAVALGAWAKKRDDGRRRDPPG